MLSYGAMWIHGGPWFLFFPFFWFLLIFGFFFLLRRRRFGRGPGCGYGYGHGPDDPFAVLGRRYAAGEIDEEEYRRRAEALRGSGRR